MWQQLALLTFWFCVLAVLHSYVLYPLLMCFLASKKELTTHDNITHSDSNVPFVSVILAAYNEEKVISEKLQNLIDIDYPRHLIRFYIGSDASTDSTNSVCFSYARENPDLISFHAFGQRRGKPPVVNELVGIAFDYHAPGTNHILLLTDASVMLQRDTLLSLARHYINPVIGCVDALMTSDVGVKGIGHSETTYMDRETRLKWCESRAWGMMIGPFGGCYTLRSNLFRPIPPRSLVDDFYLGFGALTQGYQAVNDLNAQCIERATQHISEEYRRKRRIATGSMRNLLIFKQFALQPFSRLGFAFLSHKILRWFGPWIMLIALAALVYLGICSTIWLIVLFVLCSLVALVLFFYFLHVRGWLQTPLAVHLTYFLVMNIALMHGTLLYLRGIKNDIWEPTKR